MFLGAKITIATLFILVTVMVVTVVSILMFQFLPQVQNPYMVWVVLGISTVLGIVAAYFVSVYNKAILGLLIGGYMGYLLGTISFTAISVHITASPNVRFLNKI